MRTIGKRAAARRRESGGIRRSLIERHGQCLICGRSPRRPWPNKPRELSQLCCHEIANGIHRQKALDQPYAILVLCWWCNGHVVTNKGQWPESRQLAVLKRRSPQDYDLEAYNRLVNPRAPNRITAAEVDRWNAGGVGTAQGITKEDRSLL